MLTLLLFYCYPLESSHSSTSTLVDGLAWCLPLFPRTTLHRLISRNVPPAPEEPEDRQGNNYSNESSELSGGRFWVFADHYGCPPHDNRRCNHWPRLRGAMRELDQPYKGRSRGPKLLSHLLRKIRDSHAAQ